MSKAYTGRFAPSPSGPLHFGSLVAALASFFDARRNRGRWLMRMEDLDPAREPVTAAQQILEQTQSYGMDWDGEVLFQSKRQLAYAEALESLQLPARWERVGENMILEGAHSVDRFRFRLGDIQAISGKKVGVFAMLRDHDPEAFRVVLPFFDGQ